MENLSNSVNMYYSRPMRLAKSNIEKLNFCQVSNVVCDGSPSSIFYQFLLFHPSRMCMVNLSKFVNMYYSRPMRLAKSNIEKLNFCQFSNVVCDGS